MNTEQQAAVPAEPGEMLDLDLATVKARLVDDDDGRIVIALEDADGVAYLSVRANIDAESAVRRLRLALERLEPEVRRRTIGYRAEHILLTGPTPWPSRSLPGPKPKFSGPRPIGEFPAEGM